MFSLFGGYISRKSKKHYSRTALAIRKKRPRRRTQRQLFQKPK